MQTAATQTAHFAKGAYDGTIGTGIALVSQISQLSPTAAITDFEKWKRDWSNVKDQAVNVGRMIKEDKTGLLSAVVGWEDLKSDPANWAGALGGDILLGGGIGKAAQVARTGRLGGLAKDVVAQGDRVVAKVVPGVAAMNTAKQIRELDLLTARREHTLFGPIVDGGALGEAKGKMTRSTLRADAQVIKKQDREMRALLGAKREPIGGVRSPSGGGIKVDPAELVHSKMASAVPESMGINSSVWVELENGHAGLYKPIRNERRDARYGFQQGSLASREVGASILDEHLGFELVPTTVLRDGALGPGSLQVRVENATPGRVPWAYLNADIQRLGVYDYIVGNTDRHFMNYLTGPDGRPIAIDNGFGFPSWQLEPIKSGFIPLTTIDRLEPEVLDAINKVDVNALRTELLDVGVPPRAVDGTIARLEEVRANGYVTGDAWTTPQTPLGSGELVGGKVVNASDMVFIDAKSVVGSTLVE